LVPQPKYVIVDRDTKGEITSEVFAEEQNAASFMNLLGYENG
jgi:arginine decarboxylase